MKTSKTNLDYLMKLCSVRGVDISRYLHVDQSLVGKWKNGTRKLLPDSGYPEELAALFAERGRDRIEALFADVYKDKYNPEYLDDMIKSFICSSGSAMTKAEMHKDADADSSFVYYSYDGISGRKKAMSYLLNCAKKTDTPVTLMLYDSTCFDWLVNDSYYLDKWGRKIIELLEGGSDIYLIIDPESDRQRTAALLYRFYFFSANKNFNIYYAGGVHYPTSYVIGGFLAVSGYNDSDGDGYYTQVFTDGGAVKQQELYMRRLLKSRKKESIRRFSAEECYHNMKNLSVVSNDIYMFSVIPTFYSMPPELAKRVLGYNGDIAENVKKQLLAYNGFTNGEFFPGDGKRQVRCMFPMGKLKAALAADEVIYSDNLYADEVTIRVRAEDFREHLKFLTEQMKEVEGYNIGIVPGIDDFGSKLEKLGYLACKKQCWAMVSNEHSGSKALFFMNTSIVDLIFYVQEYVWKNIPEVYTDKENAIKIIEGLIAEAQQ